MKHTFDNLIDVHTGKRVQIDVPEMTKAQKDKKERDLKHISESAHNAAQLIKQHFGKRDE